MPRATDDRSGRQEQPQARIFRRAKRPTITETIHPGQSALPVASADERLPGALTARPIALAFTRTWRLECPIIRRLVKVCSAGPAFQQGAASRTSSQRKGRIWATIGARLEPMVSLGLSSKTSFPADGLAVPGQLVPLAPRIHPRQAHRARSDPELRRVARSSRPPVGPIDIPCGKRESENCWVGGDANSVGLPHHSRQEGRKSFHWVGGRELPRRCL